MFSEYIYVVYLKVDSWEQSAIQMLAAYFDESDAIEYVEELEKTKLEEREDVKKIVEDFDYKYIQEVWVEYEMVSLYK